MADTLASVRTIVRDNLDEASAAYWTDVELNRKIVSSYRRLWKRIMSLREDYFQATSAATITIVSGQTRYTSTDGINSAFYRIKSMRTTTSGKEFIRWVGASQTDPEFIEGLRTDLQLVDPYRFLYNVIGNQSLLVSPVPRQSLSVAMEYITLPTDPSGDSSTFGVLDPFTDFIAYDATVQALAKGPTGLVEYWMGRSNEEWEDIKRTLGMPRQDQSPDIAQGAFDRYA